MSRRWFDPYAKTDANTGAAAGASRDGSTVAICSIAPAPSTSSAQTTLAAAATLAPKSPCCDDARLIADRFLDLLIADHVMIEWSTEDLWYLAEEEFANGDMPPRQVFMDALLRRAVARCKRESALRSNSASPRRPSCRILAQRSSTS